jgi:hypothetical protein
MFQTGVTDNIEACFMCNRLFAKDAFFKLIKQRYLYAVPSRNRENPPKLLRYT